MNYRYDPSDLCRFIGGDRDAEALLHRLRGEGLIDEDARDDDVLEVIRAEFKLEAEKKAEYDRVELSELGENRAHMHLDYLLEPHLSPRGLDMRYRVNGIPNPDRYPPPIVSLEDVLAWGEPKAHMGTFRLHPIRQIYVDNEEFGRPSGLNAGTCCVSLLRQFRGAERWYEVWVTSNIGTNHRGISLVHRTYANQSEAYFYWFWYLQLFDDKLESPERLSDLKITEDDFQDLYAYERKLERARRENERINGMRGGEERRAAFNAFMQELKPGGKFFGIKWD